ncbi:glycerate kinase type-2 family protein [Deferribacter abyssi]|uniref:glycerate kinase type-2 family protein n=1 Tax=Deferribacter abyssi TaxID=213806 RepID=UPI003C1733E6
MREFLLNAVNETINFVKPDNLLINYVDLQGDVLRIGEEEFDIYGRKIHVVGSGKGSVLMARALEKILKDRITGGIIISNFYDKLDTLTVVVGSHPYPDFNSVNATKMMLDYLSKTSDKDLIIYLLSGGTSALLELPEDTIDIDDIRLITKKLMDLGLDIKELNSIRKKLSKVKGGKLLKYIKGDVVTLVLSDVVGDDLAFIGSAPLYPMKDDVSKIIKKYDLYKLFDNQILNLILKEDYIVSKNVKHIIIGSNKVALSALSDMLANCGFAVIKLTSNYQGNAETIGQMFAGIYKNIVEDGFPMKRPVAIIAGGESTVEVTGSGIGGRNQHMVLAFLHAVNFFDEHSIFASVGTDGIDGPTDAAGALIDFHVWQKVIDSGMDVEGFLNRCDSYHFFDKMGGLIKTGPTGTNVCDLTVLIVK